MGFLNNLRVAYKLLILSVCGVAGMVIIGFAAYMSLKQAQVDMEIMFNRSVKSIDYIGNARYGMRYAQGMAVITTTFKDNPTRMDALEKKYDTGVKMVEENLAAYEKVPGKTAEIQSELAEIQKQWQNIKSTMG